MLRGRSRTCRAPSPTIAKTRRLDHESVQSLCGRRCTSTLRDGPVNSNTISITTGVTRRDKIKVPVNPIRRWLPQSPTRMLNVIYNMSDIVIGRAISPCLPLHAARARTDRPPKHGQGVDVHTDQAPVVAVPLLDPLRTAGPGGVTEGFDVDRLLNLSFCALINSR